MKDATPAHEVQTPFASRVSLALALSM